MRHKEDQDIERIKTRIKHMLDSGLLRSSISSQLDGAVSEANVRSGLGDALVPGLGVTSGLGDALGLGLGVRSGLGDALVPGLGVTSGLSGALGLDSTSGNSSVVILNVFGTALS